ncbi:hypothetical protein NOC27_1228 [Nitrosococcus oceani AFC27]|nr:hypothetical protein NOC27_1228 [Nitrosococcus oceani AFC27]
MDCAASYSPNDQNLCIAIVAEPLFMGEAAERLVIPLSQLFSVRK